MKQLIYQIKSVRWQQILFMILMAGLLIGTDGCKSTGKISKKERKAQIEAAKKQVKSIIDGTSTLSLDDQKQLLGDIMDKNYNDPALNSLIIKAQQKLKTALAEQYKIKQQMVDAARAKLYDLLLNKDGKTADQLEQEVNAIKAQNLKDSEIDELIDRAEKKIKDMRAAGSAVNLPVKTQIENAFDAIARYAAGGNYTQADNTIDKTLKFFSSDDVPVLIIISREGTIVDYDKPTTIKRYMNFIRDTKASNNVIDAIMTDANGKIKGLDLIKK
ncbi:MAG: hypothetical protein EOM90_16830 [Alphaproteobacteria bacterium]|nr:hypothetical protein [Alphaproteobacteria bacterium]